jgi:hypothetical protein
VVDTQGALAAGSLLGNCYMVDTNRYLGSWQEGSEELHTVGEDGQQIVWSAAPVSAEAHLEIVGFSGQMVQEAVCAPRQLGPGESAWAGRIESRGVYASFPYNVTLSLGGRQMQASCFVKVI